MDYPARMLEELSAREWQVLLPWLDSSGLALYFLERVRERGLESMLPPMVFARLKRSLAENKQRTSSLINELSEIASRFRAEGLSFAVLKGVTLWPHSTPSPSLRSQADLDFLIAARNVEQGRRILEGMGFYLHAISGRSWEFRAGKIHHATVENMYRAIPFRSVELHVEAEAGVDVSLLARTEQFRYEQLEIPALSPVDLFLGQGLHLYKHVCSELYRASHVLEFQRHMSARSGDAIFWNKLRVAADYGAPTPLKLGIATLLATRLLGDVAPQSFLAWTVDRLPPAAHLWVSRYGEQIAFFDPPGSKFYLLLQTALKPAEIPVRRPTLQALLPSGLPKFAVAAEDETLSDRLRRYKLHLRFLWIRLHFHIVEGLRYLLEKPDWSRALAKLAGPEPSSIFVANKEELVRRPTHSTEFDRPTVGQS
jgi:hypothetical protein